MTDEQAYGWRPWTTPEEAWEVAVANRGLIFKALEGLRGRIPQAVEIDELFSWAWEALYRSVVGFRPDLGYQFSTYAMVAIRNAFVYGVRVEMRGLTDGEGRRRAFPAANPLADEVGYSDGEPYERERVWEDDFTPASDQRVDAEGIVDRISIVSDPADVDLLCRYYIDGATLRELATEAGVTSEAIRLRRDRALLRVRQALVAKQSGPVAVRPPSSAASGAGPLTPSKEGAA